MEEACERDGANTGEISSKKFRVLCNDLTSGFFLKWCQDPDSNWGPIPLQGSALPTELSWRTNFTDYSLPTSRARRLCH